MNARETLCAIALEAAESAGAPYAEARVVGRTEETLQFLDGSLDASGHRLDLGLGVRVLRPGPQGAGWGYGATNILTPEGVRDAAKRAWSTAQATAATAVVTPEVPVATSGRYETSMTRDPFDVGVDEKGHIYEVAHREMLSRAGVKAARGSYMGIRQEVVFAATNGSRQHQRVTLCGGGVSAIAERDGVVQVRSAPKSWEGNLLQGGYETFQDMRLVEDAARVAEEAVALTSAAPAPEGPTTVILHGSQLSLQIHESVGHPMELDRAYGEEISLAGASFLLPERVGDVQFGSPLVNLTADGTTPLGPGTFGYDDEGTPARRSPLVQEGRFVGFLSGRDEAARLGHPSSAALRSASWSRSPIVRMINVNLEPGAGSLDDLIGGVDEGLLLANNKSWSIDDLRLNFQFACEIAYEIRGGRLTGRIFRDPVYHDVTPRFWGACSAIAGPEAWQMWGWAYCGKGDPVQAMYVGHGCAPARFDGVSVRAS